MPGVFAEELARTPAMTEGPFYPDRLPLDTDNDLVIIGNSTTPAVGEITHLSGRVLSPNGSPLNNLVVEIWQEGIARGESAVRHGVFQVVSITTTTGFASTDFATWTTLALMLLVGLMFVGGSAGSTGSSVKVTLAG